MQSQCVRLRAQHVLLVHIVLLVTLSIQDVLMATVDVLTLQAEITVPALVSGDIGDCESTWLFMMYYCNNTHAAISGQCRIQRGSSSAVGTPTFNGATQTSYSCVANENCNYDVHVISNYEGDGHTGFRVHNTGNTNVRINVRGQMYRPLVLVFVSYEPVNWILSLSSAVTIEKVLLVSLLYIHCIVYSA